MASVFIDIPGIGNVEAKNAATEATLREILAVMKAVQKNTGGKGGKGSGSEDDGGSKTAPGGPASAFGKGLGTLVKTTGMVIGGFDSLSKATTGIIQQFANVGDSVESAASIFKGVPIVGTMFTAVAGAASKVTKSYNEVTASGATFGGSINSFSQAASKAGMTMDQYGALISRNGEAMLGLGATTEEGAKRFGDVSKQLRATGSDLYALGYSTKDINEGLANYSKQLRISGRQGTQTNAELAAGAKNYLKEMDALAKVTGASRAEKEKEREQLIADGQFASATAGLNKDVADSMANMVQSMPTKNLQDFAKDVLASGSATTENSKQLAAAFPELYQQLQRQHQQTQSNIKISDQERNATLNNMKAEGKATMDRNKAAYRSNQELAAVGADVAASQRLNIDATKEAKEGQQKAASETDKMNEKMQKAQETLAGFSNSFQMALANSGILDLLMKAFTVAATLVQDIVVPAFTIMAGIVSSIGGTLLDVLSPALASFGGFIRDTVYPALQSLAAFFLVDFLPGLTQTFNDFVPVISGIADIILPPLMSMGAFIMDNLTPILIGVGGLLAVYAAALATQNVLAAAHTIATGVQTLGVMGSIAAFLGLNATMLPFVAIGAAVVLALTGLWMIFKKLGGDTKVVGDTFAWMGLKIKDWWLSLKEGLFTLLNKIPGMRGDFDADLEEIKQERKQNAEEREKVEQGISERMAANRKAADEKEQKREEVKTATDLKTIKAKQAGTKSLEEENSKKKAAQAEKDSLDYNAGSVDLLKQYAKSEGSAFIKDPEKKAQAGAETAKTEAVTKAEQEKEAKRKLAEQEEASKKKAEDEKGKGGGTTQESPSTLLASLNTKLDQLILVNKRVYDVAESQLSVQKGLTGNLYKAV